MASPNLTGARQFPLPRDRASAKTGFAGRGPLGAAAMASRIAVSTGLRRVLSCQAALLRFSSIFSRKPVVVSQPWSGPTSSLAAALIRRVETGPSSWVTGRSSGAEQPVEHPRDREGQGREADHEDPHEWHRDGADEERVAPAVTVPYARARADCCDRCDGETWSCACVNVCVRQA